MNLLMVNYEYPPIGGGAGRAHAALLAEYARQSDLRVDVLTSTTPGKPEHEQIAPNIALHKVPIAKKNLHYWTKLEVLQWLFKSRPVWDRLIDQNRYDLAHAFFAFPSGLHCYRSRRRLPYILSLRGSDVPGYNVRLGLDYKLLAGLFRRIWKIASAVVANSAGLADLAARFAPDLPIAVIPNGIDTAFYSPDPNRPAGPPYRILSVSRLITRKRLDLSIRAIRAAVDEGADIELTIAGEGNLLPQLKQLAGNLRLADRIKFIGRIEADQMPQIYRSHHLFLMTSAHEGMSNAMLEAMACGLPVVTTACEGTEELISDNGIIVPQPEPAPIARAIMQCLEDPQRLARMSLASRARAEQMSWSAVADQYLRLYKRILEGRQ